MAITRAKTSSIAQGPSTSKSFLANNPVILGGSYESIQTVDVGSGGASVITFSSIPSTYTHLQIRGIARATNTTNGILMRFNSDSSSSYWRHFLYADGASISSNGYSGTSIEYVYGTTSSQLASSFGANVVDILDYQNTNKNKTVRILSGVDVNGTGGFLQFSSGSWSNTSAISSISLTFAFAQYSSFALYGIK